MSFFFSLLRAKFVPIDKVAGRAGGTTIVIKSNARTTIKCHASYSKSAEDAVNPGLSPYLKSHKVDE